MIISNQTAAGHRDGQGRRLAGSAATTAFRARVDDAALHVLRAKEAAGLLPCGG